MKAICQALPVSILLISEGRDLYYRSTWKITEIAPSEFHTGDIIAICNRWYTLPSINHMLYSVLSKVLLKSTWDDVGVILVKEGIPYICFCDFDGAKVLTIEEFVQTRMPRGLAIRKLFINKLNIGRTPNSSIADIFTTEVVKLTPKPWYIFSASIRYGQENKYYEFVVENESTM